jgi:hypothetical protein
MKRIALTLLMVFAIALTACGTSSTNTPINSTTGNGLTTISQIAVGTLRLAGTEQDVTADQAKELLMLWKVYEEVSQSSTAAQEEVDALIDQIQETMTSDQMQVITDMGLTQQDVFAAMQSADVNSSTSVSTTTVSVPGSGGAGMPGGAPPDGGGTPPDGSGMPSDMGGEVPASGTDSAQSAGPTTSLAGTAGVPSTLVELVIQSLELKVAA